MEDKRKLNNWEDFCGEFDISDNGFLPEKNVPLLKSQFQQWEDIMARLPMLNKNKQIRKELMDDSLKDFPLKLLESRWQYQRAYVILSMLTNSYLFNDKPFEQTIPRKLAVPLAYVADYLGINPILTHASVDLYNWDLIDKTKKFELDNLKSVNLMTGTIDEEWFYLIMVAIEQVGGKILKNIITIYLNSNDREIVLRELEKFSNNFGEIKNILKRMRENCDMEVFFGLLRIYLKGSKNNEEMPKGVLYEGVSNTPQFYYGGSAAQSSLFQVIDAVFSIKHSDSYFKEIRNYMPGAHRKFIEWVENNVSILDIVEKMGIDDVCEKIVYDVKMFRSIHRGIVKNYIVDQIVKSEDNPTIQTVKSEDGQADTLDHRSDGIMGSGGTSIRSFLDTTIKETKIIKKEVNEN